MQPTTSTHSGNSGSGTIGSPISSAATSLLPQRGHVPRVRCCHLSVAIVNQPHPNWPAKRRSLHWPCSASRRLLRVFATLGLLTALLRRHSGRGRTRQDGAGRQRDECPPFRSESGGVRRVRMGSKRLIILRSWVRAPTSPPESKRWLRRRGEDPQHLARSGAGVAPGV